MCHEDRNLILREKKKPRDNNTYVTCNRKLKVLHIFYMLKDFETPFDISVSNKLFIEYTHVYSRKPVRLLP